MRSDVKILLDRLSKSQFRYKEFTDRFSDLETWPVFESVIRDPRILDPKLDDGNLPQHLPTSDIASLAPVFSEKYGIQDGQPATKGAGRSGADVRTLLTQIASAVDKGAV